ncbi:hypothetical protein [Actinomadura sp. 3N407]|uniref:hypothetical protein n=1 Tax=Actinomadura sp. 3N407 TaxID=3457423 RepID=UPI003FCD052E
MTSPTPSPELRALMEQLWPPGDPRTLATLGDLPGGFEPTETFAPVPRAKGARFLVPMTSRRTAAASLSGSGQGSRKDRLVRAGLGLGFSTGLARLLLRDRITVGMAPEALAADPAGHALRAHLETVLKVPGLTYGVGVRPLRPNSKPTLRLFDRTGALAGFAKVGWNDATRALVRTEAEVTAEVTAALSGTGAGGRLGVPRLLHHGPWRDRLVTVTAPLPARLRGHADPDTPPGPRVMLDIAESGDTGSRPLVSSALWRSLRGELEVLRQSLTEPRLADALGGFLKRVEAAHGTAELPVGRWHGDWVPWNLGWHQGVPQIWDWEHSTAEAPLGFDLLHWRFQVAFILRDRPLADAVRAVRDAARDELEPFGVPTPLRPLVGWLYLAEMTTRACRLRRGGGGWNPKLYPGVIEVLEEAG